ncbi:hypothetical protein SCUCBS95973_006190 [Sporothrix curviconia]|uniref:Short chain dehydrogenase n=1 Tax=Sporothrix curviconia TaxID=1260050 RepID=A0ABP0C548_9PEZI
MASLKGKVAFITGGGKNLGADIASELAPLGASLALHYNSPSSEAESKKTASELASKYPDIKVKLYQADLTAAGPIEKIFADVEKDFGHIDIVINTIGKVLKKPITEITEKEYDTMFAINSKSAFFITKEAAKHVTDGGKIVNIVTSLLAAFAGNYTAYAGSKAPVEHITRGVSKELQDRGISVNAIAPGPMDTPFFYPEESDEAVAFHKSQAMGNRLTDTKDIAPIVRFLVTEGGWINGQTIFPNGGYTTR